MIATEDGEQSPDSGGKEDKVAAAVEDGEGMEETATGG